jgi:hypothetical protein
MENIGKLITQHQNGNAEVSIDEEGTRVITYPDVLELEYPLNIDIRVTTACSLGLNPKTGKAVCSFCHESARVDGQECDYGALKSILGGLPHGTELAIGGNRLTPGLEDFLVWGSIHGYICNLTVNHLHVNRDGAKLKGMLEAKVIRGLGISYRKDYPLNFDEYFIQHPNTILHVIAGIDEVDDILNLPFQKVLILGYKTFGFGVDYYSDEVVRSLQRWFWWVSKLFGKKVVSFDNLAIEQLNIRRFFKENKWEEFYQGEHSFYIDAVAKEFRPSSRDAQTTPWNIGIKQYFKSYVHNQTPPPVLLSA